MSINVRVSGPVAHVRIEVLGYENPAAENVSDANWLTCRVEVSVRGFEAAIRAAFTTQDFAAFSRSLRSALTDLNGEPTFETDEDALRLDVKFNRTGSVSVTGLLRDPDHPKTFLAFSFESDQTFMRRTVDALHNVTQQFPVRT